MEVRSPSDTYHILYKHDTSKVSITLLTQMLPPSLTLLVVKCVIPFMLLIHQREIKLCLSVYLPFVIDKSKMVLLLLINCLCTPHCSCVCVWCSVFVFVSVCITLCPFSCSNHLEEEDFVLLSHPCLAILYVL